MAQPKGEKVPISVSVSEHGGQVKVDRDTLETGPEAPRYAMYHSDKGVWIEGNLWSNDPPEETKSHNRVVTLIHMQIEDFKKTMAGKEITGITEVRVEPDCKFGLVSIRNLKKAGLPVWEYDESTYGPDPNKEDDDAVPAIDFDELPETQGLDDRI